MPCGVGKSSVWTDPRGWLVAVTRHARPAATWLHAWFRLPYVHELSRLVQLLPVLKAQCVQASVLPFGLFDFFFGLFGLLCFETLFLLPLHLFSFLFRPAQKQHASTIHRKLHNRCNVDSVQCVVHARLIRTRRPYLRFARCALRSSGVPASTSMGAGDPIAHEASTAGTLCSFSTALASFCCALAVVPFCSRQATTADSAARRLAACCHRFFASLPRGCRCLGSVLTSRSSHTHRHAALMSSNASAPAAVCTMHGDCMPTPTLASMDGRAWLGAQVLARGDVDDGHAQCLWGDGARLVEVEQLCI